MRNNATPTHPMRQRLKPLAWLAVAALLLHWAVLGGLQWAWPQRVATPLPSEAMNVRVVTAQPVEDAAARPTALAATVSLTTAVATAVTATQPVDQRPRARAPEVPAASARAKLPLAVRAAERATLPVPAPVALAEAPPPRFTPMSMEVPAGPRDTAPPVHEPASPAEEAIPHYRTQMPPAVLLRYELQRGGLSGSGDLLWRPQGDHYALQLDGRVGPLAVLTQVSTGGFDAAGLAPARFTDRRLRRPASAANFQRDAGKITFSGPSTELALHPGTQDRLSWMVQLAAIIAAEPALRNAGAKVVIGVVGVHADAAVWALRCLGREPVETGAGVVDAIKYLREPHDPYDTTVQVWLDPKHYYLPVHATQKSGPNDEGFSLRLQEISTAP